MKANLKIALIVLGSLLAGAAILYFTVPTVHTVTSYYNQAESLQEMALRAPFIVRGSFKEQSSSKTGQQSAEDAGRITPDTYTEVEFWTFEPREILKSTLSLEPINIQIQHGRTFYYGDNDSKSVFLNVPVYLEPQTDGEYLLFLDQSKEDGSFFAPFEPWQIRIEGDTTILESNLVHHNPDLVTDVKVRDNGRPLEFRWEIDQHAPYQDEISGKSLEKIVQEIQKAANPDTTEMGQEAGLL